MGLVKYVTQYICGRHPKFGVTAARPDWEMHPSWTTGMEALNAYNHWVSEVVLPIAFQWIEENKAEVYKRVAEENKDDVGVVIAAAFELVKGLSAHQKGIAAHANYEAGVADGSWDTSTMNPVWAKIAGEVRANTAKTFAGKADVLKDTIR